jgi:hypothetical protein
MGETNLDVEAVKRTLPNVIEVREKLLTLRFFALCPNGNRIPVESICEEYSRNPNGLVYRTFEDRLVLVIQAMFPDREQPYWQQAFYYSTGKSSGMPLTWLPFDGIVMQGLYFQKANSKPLPQLKQMASAFARFFPAKKKANNEFNFLNNETLEPRHTTYTGQAWFSKNPFYNWSQSSTKSFGPSAPVSLTPRMQINELLDKAYGPLYLPEGNYLSSGYGFSRFGTASYALASHALGGKVFEEGKGGPPCFLLPLKMG